MMQKRHKEILSIIKSHAVETQEELTRLLNQKGFPITQATVSRDINKLNLVKIAMGDGKSRYATYSEQREALDNKFLMVFQQSYVSGDYAGNIVVVKTLPGMAQAAAAVIDSLEMHEIVGTIAGDDTVMMVCRTEEFAVEIVTKLRRMSKK